MALDFPSNPTSGQIYRGFIWDSSKTRWSPYTNVANTFLYVPDKSSNILVNSSCAVSLENGNTASTSNTYYPVDQFTYQKVGSMVINVWQDTDAPPGYNYSLKANCTTANTTMSAGDYVVLQQRIEGRRIAPLKYGTSDAKLSLVGGWVKSSANGTYTCAIRNAALDRSFLSSFTINTANTWEYKTLTIDAKTDGTWLTSTALGADINICLAANSTFGGGSAGWQSSNKFAISGQSNFVDAVGKNFLMTGWTWINDTTAPTSVQAYKMMQDYANEEYNCQRYFVKDSTTWLATAQRAATGYYGTGGVFYWYYPTRMRIAPNISFTNSGSFQYYNQSGVWTTFTPIAASISDLFGYISAGTDAATSTLWKSTSGSVFSFNARM